MDLSGLKWPLIIVVVVAIGWLLSSGGVNWMIGQATKSVPGQDAAQDAKDEARLSKIAGYCMVLWRYEKAAEVLDQCFDRYGSTGANYYHNMYRMVKCQEKLGQYQRAYNILQELLAANAWTIDSRVPNFDNLNLRAQKMREVHELQP
jgi:tetratricopeptide (TPR) repeat protein